MLAHFEGLQITLFEGHGRGAGRLLSFKATWASGALSRGERTKQLSQACFVMAEGWPDVGWEGQGIDTATAGGWDQHPLAGTGTDKKAAATTETNHIR